MGRTVRAGDVQLFVEEVGPKDAPPVLVMHGGLGFDHSYLRDFDRLAADRRVIYYDHRGKGQSPVVSPDGVTMSTLASDAVALSEALELGPPLYVHRLNVAVRGHFPWLEEPEKFWSELYAFLEAR